MIEDDGWETAYQSAPIAERICAQVADAKKRQEYTQELWRWQQLSQAHARLRTDDDI